MPRLYLREAEPFLPQDKKIAMERHMDGKKSFEQVPEITDPTKKRRLTKRTASLIVCDAAVVVVEMLQILALIQSMGLKWSWSKTWIKYTNFIFIFNADAWEFMKVQSGAYTRIQGKETASSEISLDYNHILIAWAGLLTIVGLVFLITFLVLKRRQPPYLMVHYAKMERIFLIMVQVLALPLGTAVFRLFHCTGSDKMAVFDSKSCYEGLYWAYLAPSILLIIALFGAVSFWMIYRIRKQKLAAVSRHHNAYLKLKEVEYEAGLDVVWAVQGFYLFSSFRLCAVYYRPLVHMIKLLLLVFFSALFLEIHAQAICTAVILALSAIAVPLVRPFRVTSFNVALGLSLGCLAGNAVFGSVVTSVTPADVESPWLVEPYSYSILIGINVILACTLLTWFIWLVCRMKCACCSRWCFTNSPLWPTLLSYEYKVDGAETYKFMAAVLRARAVLDACLRAPSVFAPVHHLARHIQIVNVCCREAEKTRDGMHPTLLHLLDDMTDVHRRLEPGSLFAEKVHENIRQNAANFVVLMPAFCHRLAQRDFDLMLVDPVKKRMLLKMSIIAMFVNKNNQKLVKDSHTEQGLHQLWNELPDMRDPRTELEYQEDLHPLPVTGPDTESQYMTGVYKPPLQLMDLHDSDEEESLATFLSRVPPILVMKNEISTSRSSSVTHLASLADHAPAPDMTPVGVVEVSAEVTQHHRSETTAETTDQPMDTSSNTEDQNTKPASESDETAASTLPEFTTSDMVGVSEIGLVNQGFVEDEGAEVSLEAKTNEESITGDIAAGVENEQTEDRDGKVESGVGKERGNDVEESKVEAQEEKNEERGEK
ncbi:hypothetical protein PoB_000563500 [Plakobranchus ocellatus]|uniref:G-protein coupled receptors family 1 profile domain-containing protein n=1 Tax=Plakobranchus ocellatus TaxID=259542 RepID=A0AAV3Y7M3_9GAST|nr:hypothetical protein PoB_000563500 [Plakobranchus ocellatus]